MSTAEASRRPVEQFLGPGSAAGGPFALLALDPARCDRADVLAALDRQLARIAAHAQGQTPSADEVRVALHAAAAQLLDPEVLRSMRARWSAGSVGGAEPPGKAGPHPVGGASAPTPTDPETSHARSGPPVATASPRVRPTGLDPRFEAEARSMIALAGGPSPEALMRLGALARSRGVSVDRVPEIVRLLASPPPAPVPIGSPAPGSPGRPVMSDDRPMVSASATGGAAAVGAPLEADPFALRDRDDSSRTMRVVAVYSAVGLCLMAGAFWAVLLMTAPKGRAPAPVRTPDTLTGHVAQPDGPTDLFPRVAAGVENHAPSVGPERGVDSAALVEGFRAAVAARDVDPEKASMEFRALCDTTGSIWPEIPLDRRRAIVDLIVEFVYRSASSPEGPVPVLEDLASGASLLEGTRPLEPEDVGRVSWSVGVLVRLQRERDISARAGSLIESRLGAALEGVRPVGASAFDAGAIAALGVMPRRLIAVGDPSRTREGIDNRLRAWSRWVAAIDAAVGSDAVARAGLILSGLDALLRDAGEPTDDRVVFESIAVLVEALDFSEGAPARSWLVRTLDAPGVSTSDAHALLNAVATRAPSGRLDVSMVLAPRATDLERREMRDRLAILWNLADPADRDALASAWREAWAEALSRRDSDLTPFEHLATAVVLSRVSQAALLRWRGMTQEAEALLGTLDDDIDATLSPATASTTPTAVAEAGDGRWADQYLQAGRSIPIRLDLLRTAATT